MSLATTVYPTGSRPVHPLHALLLAFPIALFASALLSDITYLKNAEMQWSNFSAWLIVGALVFGAPVLLWAGVGFFRRRRDPERTRALVYFLLLLIMWIAGLINAFKHSQDAWSSVGAAGVTLSIISTLTAFAAGWIAYSGERIAR
jgi:uncharacterized membrane protein